MMETSAWHRGTMGAVMLLTSGNGENLWGRDNVSEEDEQGHAEEHSDEDSDNDSDNDSDEDKASPWEQYGI